MEFRERKSCLYGGEDPAWGLATTNSSINVSLTWQPDYPNEPCPESIIIVESASLSTLQKSPPAVTMASCNISFSTSDGLNNYTDIGEAEDFAIAKTKYRLLKNPSSSVNFQVQMNCTYFGELNTGLTGMILGWINANLNIKVHNMEVVLSGTKRDNQNKPHILIGQKCQANFAAGNGTTPPSYYPFFPPLEEFINDFTWSIPGNTFARNWANPAPHSTFTGSLVRHPNIPITVDFSPAGHSSQQEWFWKSDSSGSLYKISSIAHFVILGNHPFWNVPGAGYTIVDKPIWTKISSQSLPWSVIQLINSNGPVAFPSNHILFSSDKVYTVRFDGSVSQPAPFDTLTSSGYWIYLQTIKAQNYQFDAQGNILHSAVTWADDFTIFPYTKRVMEGLDNYWPYNGITYSTIDGSHSQTDRPSWGILQLTRSISINNDFHMYVMYCPPDAGLGTEWIALSRMDWNWNLSASFPWGTGGLGVASLAGEAIFPDFPAWYSVYPNSLPQHSGGN